MTAVLVHWSFCHKTQHSGWLVNNRKLCLIAPEAKNPTSRCWLPWPLVRCSLGTSLCNINTIPEGSILMTKSPPKGPAYKRHHIGNQVLTCSFANRTQSFSPHSFHSFIHLLHKHSLSIFLETKGDAKSCGRWKVDGD